MGSGQVQGASGQRGPGSNQGGGQIPIYSQGGGYQGTRAEQCARGITGDVLRREGSCRLLEAFKHYIDDTIRAHPVKIIVTASRGMP